MSAREQRQHRPTSTQHTTDTPTTRIPVTPSSSLRRWGSFKAANLQCEGNNRPCCARYEADDEREHPNAPGALQRGHSFMERGERKRVPKTEPRRQAGPSARALNGAPQTPTRIRSLSLSLANASSRLNSPKSPTVATLPKTPPTTPDARHQSYHDWETESVTSNTSGISVASCDHASIARNGTTFSGRSKRFMVHCPEHSGATGEDYLTPTQRAHQQVKRLKQLLQQAQKDLDSKDSDILKLTKEVVELRLYKAALSSPEDKSTSSNSGDAVTVVENQDDVLDGEGPDNQNSSCADSGHYDDLSNSREDIGLSPSKSKADKAITANLGSHDTQSEQQKLILEYERRLQELVRTHEEECHQMKQRHNDKVEELLQRLSEVNARYWELVPDLDAARERIRELEKQLDEACKKLEEQEARFKEETQPGLRAIPPPDVAANSSRISVPDLLHQLEVTQNELENVKAMYRQLLEARNKNKIDPEITLQFLKSAIYYFLTDKENNQGHLRAIQNILGFTPIEISNIDKARMT